MSERYTRLFSLPEHLYATDSPVLIVAGALLKDNQSGQVLAQLKLQNIGTKTIKAASVEITLLDTAGKPLGGTVDYQYLDLSASRDATFGQKTPIVLPNAATRSFTVRVTELIFADNSDWPGSSAPWEPLLEQERLENALGSEVLVTQYQLLYGSCCHYQVLEERGLWRCACGGINRRGEPTCHVCGNRFDALSATTVATLTAARNARLAMEKQKAAEQRAKNVRILKIAVPVVAVVIAIVAVLCWHSSKDKDTDTGQALDVIQEHSATPVPIMKTPYDQTPEPVGAGTYTEAYDNASVEEYVTEIRGMYNEIASGIQNDQYVEMMPKQGVMVYFDQGEIRSIAVQQGVDGNAYRRFYYYANGELIFAYYEANDANRLYFHDDKLIRWRYSINATDPQNAINHDLEVSNDYLDWERTALSESYLLIDESY